MGDALHVDGVTTSKEARIAQAGGFAVQGPAALDARTGVLAGPGSTALVTGTSATGTMTVSIAPHHWFATRGSANGPYLGALEAATTVNIAAAPAAGAGTRIDVIYVRQKDATAGVPTPDGATAPEYGVVAGTAGGAKPGLTSVVGAEELATVAVAPGATRTDSATYVTITNTARQTVARGARVPCRSQAEEDALTKYNGLEVYRLDTGQVKLTNGTTFAVVYDPNGDPGSRFLGQATGIDNTATSSATPAAVASVTVPANLATGRRLKVTGTLHVLAPAGVGATVAVPGLSRTLNVGGISSEVTVIGYVADLTPGARTFTLTAAATVGGQTLTFRAPVVSVEVV